MAATLRSARDYLIERVRVLVGALMSLNDPNWGRRPGGGNQGPPDLEELWRNLNGVSEYSSVFHESWQS